MALSAEQAIARIFADAAPRRFGTGWISGVLAVLLGVLSLAAVLCLHFPQWLTIPELRSKYPLELVRDRSRRKRPIKGFEADRAARTVLAQRGHGGDQVLHRTGHSLHVSDHGPGANMDNLETHDTRRLIAWTGFSIEPGIYLPGDFGVRSEIDVALTPEGAEVTGGEPQRELLRLVE